MEDGVVEHVVPEQVDRAIRGLQRAMGRRMVTAILIFDDQGVPSVLVPGHVPMERERKAALCDAVITGLQIFGFIKDVRDEAAR